MNKTWTHYPTHDDRKACRNGIEMNGQVWSGAPVTGGEWVVPFGQKRAILVVTRTVNNIRHSWSVEGYEGDG